MENHDENELESIIKVEKEEFDCSNSNIVGEINFEWPRSYIFDALKPSVVLERLDRATILKLTRRWNQNKQHSRSPATKHIRQGIVVLHHKGPYFCDRCGKSLKNREAITSHVKRLHLVKNFLFCDVCPKSFNLKSSMEAHKLQSHSKEKLAVKICSICEHKCMTSALFEEHMKKVHPGKTECKICHKFVTVMWQHLAVVHSDQSQREFPCKICGSVIKGRFNVKNHMKAIHGKKHKCDQCGKGFNFYDLRIHKVQAHHVGKIFFCECGKPYKSRNNLRGHRFLVHTPTFCEVCNETFSGDSGCNQHWLKYHLETHGPRKIYKQSMKTTAKRVFECETCFRTYSTLMKLRIHQKEVHLSAPRFWTCDLCEKLFKIKALLEKHIQSLHLKKFICEVCNHEADDPKSLKTHKKIHEKRKECQICHKMVISLKNHIKTHDVVKCECKFCGTILGNNAKLKVHLAFMHKDGKANKKKCKECDAEFFYLDALKLHVLTTHFKGKLLECEKCNAIFKRKDELRSHIKNMHKTFDCPICCKKFKWQSLLTHWKNEHLKDHGTYTAYKNSKKHFTTKGPFTCDICNKVRQTRKEISQHLSQHFSFKRRNGFFKVVSKRQSKFLKVDHFCDICGKVFPERSRMWSHMYKHLHTLARRYERFLAGRKDSRKLALG